MNIYVGNLGADITQEELKELFETYGKTESVSIVKDKYSGQSRGFGFVEMPAKSEGLAAIAGLNSKAFKGQTLSVNEARPRTESPRGGGGRRF